MMSYHSTSKDNIVRHNISYNFAFGSNSIFHISQDIRVTYNVSVILTTFLAISPDPLDRFCSPQRQYCRQQNFLYYWSSSFFLYLSYFSRFSQKTSQAPQLDHFLTTFLPISPDPMSRFCSSSKLASQIKI